MMGSYLRDYEDAQMDEGFLVDPIPKHAKKTHPIVLVDRNHPFDLDAYISNYSGTLVYFYQRILRIHQINKWIVLL